MKVTQLKSVLRFNYNKEFLSLLYTNVKLTFSEGIACQKIWQKI